MTILEFLSRLLDLDVRLWVDDEGRLRYSAPQGVMTPDLRAELVERKKETIAFLCSAGGTAYQDSPPILPVSREGDLPLSFAQRRLWFLDQLEPNSAAYNVPGALRISGQLSVSVLERSLNEVVRRHEALRTTFVAVTGEAVQVIASALTLPLPVVDVGELPEMAQEVEVQRLAAMEARRPFDLATGPLVRCALLRLGEEEHVLLLTMHHIVSDGWSIGAFFQEMVTLGHAYSSGQPSPLLELPIQYADFAVWQRGWLQGEVLKRQLAYWRQQLKGASLVLELPTDWPRPPVQTYRGALQSFELPESLLEALNSFSRREGVTLFMTLLAAFNTLLYRYTGQTDIIVGSPIANRNRAEIEGLIGFFVNTLALRTDLKGNPSFRELLGRVRKVTLGAYTHQDLPFEMLVEELQPERDLSRPPLFQVMFVLQNAPMLFHEHSGLTFNLLEVDSGVAKFDLTLSMVETAQGLSGVLEYSTDLFDTDTMARLVDHFRVLLGGVVADPDLHVADVPILTETERHQLLVEWNDTRTTYPGDACIHELFETQVKKTPDGVAVVLEDQHLTHQELNRRANQLAHCLRTRGVEPDCLVGIYMKRSLETMVGILGVLKAGGAYVPLDPAYPEERLTFMQADAQTPVLLTRERLAKGLSGHKAQVICLDTDWESIARESDENPVSGVTADNLAYVIYTSGSTGQPKGVLVPHRGLPNVVEAMVRTFDLTPADRVLQFSSLSFDASVYDILLALGGGATLCLAQESLVPDLSLSHWLRDVGVTIIPLTVSALAALSDEELSTLRVVISGAEPLPAELVTRWLKRNRRFFNVYGPTEATIWVTVTECFGDGQKPTIGWPISNVQAYILDPCLRPVPVGVPGEMCVGGVGVTRGYMNSPALTAEKFVPHPFSKEPGARLYRTGDLARCLPDGRIDFLGRIDHQVKVRGFRIELGEIETVLVQHPAVEKTIALVREDNPGDKRLVAYIIPNDGQEPTVGNLRRFLREKLPDYMVPSAFVTLETLPLTPSGKVNRRVLPVPEQGRPELDKEFVAPRSPIEEKLAAIFSQVLNVKRVGVADDFFELGGHSLLATQVVSRIRQAFQVELPLRDFFGTPTVAGLARAIDGVSQVNLSAAEKVISSEDFEEGRL